MRDIFYFVCVEDTSALNPLSKEEGRNFLKNI
jgi:hypothetical protein